MSNDPANADLRTDATVPSRRCDTGPSNIMSYNSGNRQRIDGIEVVEVETDALRGLQQRQSGRFLKGPIPLRDVAAAAKMAGKALAVLLAVHHRSALTRSRFVHLPRSLMLQLGVTKDAKARALQQLEVAGLIEVERRIGRPAVIKLTNQP